MSCLQLKGLTSGTIIQLFHREHEQVRFLRREKGESLSPAVLFPYFFPQASSVWSGLTRPGLAQSSMSSHSAREWDPSSSSRDPSLWKTKRKIYHSLRNFPFNRTKPYGSSFLFSQINHKVQQNT